MNLSLKESQLLTDMMTQEQVCIDKYGLYAEKAQDPQLKNLFSSLAKAEQQHFNTLSDLSRGISPQMSAQPQPKPSFSPKPNPTAQPSNDDAFLCQDLLSTEKHVSSAYNTAIFEFRDSSARNVLNHIQKEEQEHGKQLYDYMAAHDLY